MTVLERFVLFVQKYKKTVIGMLLLITVFCLFLLDDGNVHFDWTKYLLKTKAPVSAELEVQLSEVSVPEALQYKQAISELPGVQDVLWLDDVVPIYEPLEFQERSIVEQWYFNRNAFLKVTADQKMTDVVSQIRSVAGEKGTIEGTLADRIDQQSAYEREIRILWAVVLSAAALFLVLTTDSWANALLSFVTLLMAVLINEGTDALFGEVFYLTKMSELLIQIPLAMICAAGMLTFLKHKKGLRIPALFAAILLICSVSLCGMRFGLGKELSRGCLKTVIVTVCTVCLMIPAWSALFEKWIGRTRHGTLCISTDFAGRWIWKLRFVILTLMIPVMLIAGLAQKEITYRVPESGSDAIVLLVPADRYVAAGLEKRLEMNEELSAAAGVNSVVSYQNQLGTALPEEYLEESELSPYKTGDYSRFVIVMNAEVEQKSTVDAVRMIAEKYYGEDAVLSGDAVAAEELERLSASDRRYLNVVIALVAALCFLAIQRSILLTVLSLFMTYGTVWINLMISYLDGRGVWLLNQTPVMLLLPVSSMGMALLSSLTYLELRRSRMRRKTMNAAVCRWLAEGMIPAVAGAVPAIAAAVFMSNEVLRELGNLMFRQILISVWMQILVFPLLMLWADHGIEKTAYRPGFYRKGNGKSEKENK